MRTFLCGVWAALKNPNTAKRRGRISVVGDVSPMSGVEGLWIYSEKNKEITCGFKVAVEADLVDSPKIVSESLGSKKANPYATGWLYFTWA